MTFEPEIVRIWLRQIRDGEEYAARQLWECYSSRLMKVARRNLSPKLVSIADEEDMVVCAFESFFRRARAGAYQEISDHAALWKLLVTITLNATFKFNRDGNRCKRFVPALPCNVGGTPLDGRSYLLLENLISKEPSPECLACAGDSCDRLLSLLVDQEIKQIVLAKLQGYTNQEIAIGLGHSLATIERRLKFVRHVWEYNCRE